jgi:hypothetical protein
MASGIRGSNSIFRDVQTAPCVDEVEVPGSSFEFPAVIFAKLSPPPDGNGQLAVRTTASVHDCRAHQEDTLEIYGDLPVPRFVRAGS